LFTALNVGLLFGSGREIFVIYLLAHVIVHLQGLWILIVYVSFAKMQQQNNRIRCSSHSHQFNVGGSSSFMSMKMMQKDKYHKNDNTTDNAEDATITVVAQLNHSESGEENYNGIQPNNIKRNYDNNTIAAANEFSIFDGTNPSHAWKDFIFDGEDEDYIEDQAEAEKWKDVIQT